MTSAPAGGSYPPHPPAPGAAAAYDRPEPSGQGSGMSHDRSSYDSAPYVERPTTNTLAVVALVTGILILCCGCLLGLPAIICGHIAHSQVKASGGRQTGAGMAIAGFILGYLGILGGIAWIILNVLMEQGL